MTLTGFTLFYNPGKKSWQMSVRTDVEVGWSVNFVPDEQAQAVLRLLESRNEVHGCGPWAVKAPIPGPLTIEDGFKQLTEALRGLA